MNVLKTSFVILLLCGFSFAEEEMKGKSTRYWDCCKPSCGWYLKAKFSQPVWSCDADGRTILEDFDTKSSCDIKYNGTAYSCSSNQPWAVNETLSYGFVATSIGGHNESVSCCACYLMTFTSEPVAGQQMIVQATNTGSELAENQFDIQMPGGGVGIFNGCSAQFEAPEDGWGKRYGGISTIEECDDLPLELQAGCHWRFDWFKGADNPEFTFHRIKCPSQLTTITGCIRDDEE